MKPLNRNMHGDDPAFHRLPDDAELAVRFTGRKWGQSEFFVCLRAGMTLDGQGEKLTLTPFSPSVRRRM